MNSNLFFPHYLHSTAQYTGRSWKNWGDLKIRSLKQKKWWWQNSAWGQLQNICANLTIIHKYCRLCLSGLQAQTFIQCSMETNSTLTLVELLCLGLGSVESFSRRSCPANLSFTLRLSHSLSQNGDSALIRTTTLKVMAAVAEKKSGF